MLYKNQLNVNLNVIIAIKIYVFYIKKQEIIINGHQTVLIIMMNIQMIIQLQLVQNVIYNAEEKIVKNLNFQNNWKINK